ncbi:putative NRPS-like protein biosynthetic cluster [Tephrocybe sp. NHM501043]|nr:putative NRPS-like protein biosynthetic cluster [Tephrocybe sp. NHM501043]
MAIPSLSDDVQRIVHGYSLLEWPDLSATRRPHDVTHTTGENLSPSRSERVSRLILAISRILGAYCGASDILIALDTELLDLYTFIRVTWSNSNNWNDVLATIGSQMHSTAPTMLSAINHALDLNPNQSPCMAVCRVSFRPPIPSQSFPLAFTYNPSEEKLSLVASLKHVHAAVSYQIVSQVARTLEHIEIHPTTTISLIDLPSKLMSACERTTSEKGLEAAYPLIEPVSFVTDYLTRRSITNPNSIALHWYPNVSTPNVFESISYISFHQQANQVARWLRRIGLETEDRVAVCMARDVLFHITMVGIMRAGGCYVPIDPDLPDERKTYIARDSDARFVFTTARISSLSLFGSRTIFFDNKTVQTPIKGESYDEINFATPEGLAFLLYTSGKPKFSDRSGL